MVRDDLVKCRKVPLPFLSLEGTRLLLLGLSGGC